MHLQHAEDAVGRAVEAKVLPPASDAVVIDDVEGPRVLGEKDLCAENRCVFISSALRESAR